MLFLAYLAEKRLKLLRDASNLLGLEIYQTLYILNIFNDVILNYFSIIARYSTETALKISR